MPRKDLTAVVTDLPEDGAVKVDVMLPERRRRREYDARRRSGSTSNPPNRPRIPRITRLMALAIKYEGMVARGELRDYADIARLGYITRARATQVMNLRHLAPDIQEHLLFLDARVEATGITERDLRSITAAVYWGDQRKIWCPLSSSLRHRKSH